MLLETQSFRVLVIETDASILERIRGCLSRSGDLSFEIAHAFDADEACELAADRRFDVLLASWSAQGLEAVDRLQEVARAPIIVLGTSDDHWLGVQLVRHSVQDFLDRERLDERVLVRSILFAIERFRREEQLRQRADALLMANERLDRLAGTDPLTQVLNRRGFERAISRDRRRSEGKKPSAILVDCDDFKHINDVHGHAIGDVVLREIARRLSTCLRRTDSISRVGGDEFLILLPDTGQNDALMIADRARNLVGRDAIETSVGPISTTVSISVCALAPGDASLEKVLRQLQLGMTESKVGKDCVSISEDLPVVTAEDYARTAE